MFKLSQSNSYYWPVTVEMPADGGKFEKHTFDAEFRRMSVDELQALGDTDETGGIACRTIMVGWKGIVDDSGEEVPFSETSRDQLLQWPTVRIAIMQSFRASLAGAGRKN